MSFLSAYEIVDAIINGELKIAYYFIPGKNGKLKKFSTKKFVKFPASADDDADDKLVREFFLESLQPDSITIHVGPYAKISDAVGKKRKSSVLERKGDKILKVGERGQLIFLPEEFLLVGTNEYFEVSDKIGASVYSVVRNTDIGLSQLSAIIDPTWKGILQIGISNGTRFHKRLNANDALALLRFHKIDLNPNDALNKKSFDSIKEKFRDQRPHFGLDWWKLEAEEGRSFFPVRKEYEPLGDFDKQQKNEARSRKFKKLAKLILGLLPIPTIFAAGVFAVDLKEKIDETLLVGKELESISHRHIDYELTNESYAMNKIFVEKELNKNSTIIFSIKNQKNNVDVDIITPNEGEFKSFDVRISKSDQNPASGRIMLYIKR